MASINIKSITDSNGVNHLIDYTSLDNKPTVTSEYSSAGTEAVNGVAVASAISTKQDAGDYVINGGNNKDISITANDSACIIYANEIDLAMNENDEGITILPTAVGVQTTKLTVNGNDVTNDHATLLNKEDASNKVTAISSGSTDTEYPSAKCVYDLVGDIESILNTING